MESRDYTVEYEGEVYTYSELTKDMEGNPVFGLVDFPQSLYTEGVEQSLELAFESVTAIPGPKFKAEVGLAGRLGGVEYSEVFDDIEEAMVFCLSHLWKDFINENGKFHRVDAIR